MSCFCDNEEKNLFAYLKENLSWLCPCEFCSCWLHCFFKEFAFTFENNCMTFFGRRVFRLPVYEEHRKEDQDDLTITSKKYSSDKCQKNELILFWFWLWYIHRYIYTYIYFIFKKWLLLDYFKKICKFSIF